MNVIPGTTRLTADGVVGTSGAVTRVYSIHLVSGGTASSTIFRDGTSTGGTATIQVDGLASSGVTLNFAGGVLFKTGCFMDTDANISYCIIVYSQEVS